MLLLTQSGTLWLCSPLCGQMYTPRVHLHVFLVVKCSTRVFFMVNYIISLVTVLCSSYDGVCVLPSDDDGLLLSMATLAAAVAALSRSLLVMAGL